MPAARFDFSPQQDKGIPSVRPGAPVLSPTRALSLHARLVARDERALAELIELITPWLLGMAQALLSDPDEAEEVVQEAFTIVWNRIGRVPNEPRGLLAWVLRTARNRAIDRLRWHTRWRRKSAHLVANRVDGEPIAAAEEPNEAGTPGWHVAVAEGPSRISREANGRRIAVKCSVRGRDQGSFVAEAQRKVAERVALPPGYHMVWGGQFENQRRAMARLAVIVPTSIALIFLLLFSAFGSTKYATLILANLPLALIGGVGALAVRHLNLSVSAAVGFIALFGISVQNGVLLVSEFNRLRDESVPLEEALRLGAMDRLRPVVMTALMAALGLLPAALSHGVGAETTRPFASVIVGGMASSTLLTLLVLPVLYRVFHEEPHEEIPR